MMMLQWHWGSHADIITELQILMISGLVPQEHNLVFDKNVSLSTNCVKHTYHRSRCIHHGTIRRMKLGKSCQSQNGCPIPS